MSTDGSVDGIGSESIVVSNFGVPRQGTGCPEGDAIVAEYLERFHSSDALRVVDELIERVISMKIAGRFNGDLPPNWTMAMLRGMPNPAMTGCPTEAEAKRTQLLIHLRNVRVELLNVFGRLSSVVLDVEVAGRDFVGD